MLNALAAALNPGKDPTPSTHRLRRGLPGYLILFAPHAFVPQRQFPVQKAAFATGVLPNIYAFHRYTRNSAFLSCTQVCQFARLTMVKPLPFTLRLANRLRTLYAQ